MKTHTTKTHTNHKTRQSIPPKTNETNNDQTKHTQNQTNKQQTTTNQHNAKTTTKILNQLKKHAHQPNIASLLIRMRTTQTRDKL